MMKNIFLPPGVQARLFTRFGRCPRQADDATASKLDALWQRRNQAPENELDAIDDEIERLVADVASRPD
jgi:hypothetical protein